SAVQVNPAGELEAETTSGTLRDEKPVAYQEIAGMRVPVSALWEVLPCQRQPQPKGLEAVSSVVSERSFGRSGPAEAPRTLMPGPPCPSFRKGSDPRAWSTVRVRNPADNRSHGVDTANVPGRFVLDPGLKSRRSH